MDKTYCLSLNIETKDLVGIPDGGTAAQVMYGMVMQFIMAWGKQEGGLVYEDQKKMRHIRIAMENALKVKEDKITLTVEQFNFLNKCAKNTKLMPEGNEAIFRAVALIDKAIEEFEKVHGKPEAPIKEEA